MKKKSRYSEFLTIAEKFRAKVVALYGAGNSQSEIARKLHVTRQRIHQIINDNASKARKKINHEVATNRRPAAKTMKCVDCGATAAEYDHRDYSKPRAIQPVCAACNKKRGVGKNGKSRQRVYQILGMK